MYTDTRAPLGLDLICVPLRLYCVLTPHSNLTLHLCPSSFSLLNLR